MKSVGNATIPKKAFMAVLDQGEARAAVSNYVEGFCNRLRFHAALKYQSPEQFEARRCS